MGGLRCMLIPNTCVSVADVLNDFGTLFLCQLEVLYMFRKVYNSSYYTCLVQTYLLRQMELVGAFHRLQI